MIKNSLLNSHKLFLDLYSIEPDVISLAPGRINIIGEHTDYNLGFVLPAAIDRNIQFLAKRRKDNKISVWAENFQERENFFVDDLKAAHTKKWVDYVKGIFWVLKKEGYSLGGIDSMIRGNIPLESGLSSSAALEVSILNALNQLFHLSLSKEQIARLSQVAENDYVGVNCGLMDQFISVFGKKNTALFLDCETLKHEHVPLPLEEHGLNIVVYDSRVRRELSASDYNKRRLESRAALKILKTQKVKSFKDVDKSLIENKKNEMGDILFRRARHVITENQRVKDAVRFIKTRDFQKLGGLLFQSHLSLRDDYEVSCPELDLLYEVGEKFGGCLGARMTGAGFGGSGIALVKEVETEAFVDKMKIESKVRQFSSPAFFKVSIDEGARIL
ncbi:MAG: galactokinase [Candidatus Aminicenantes bacterium]|nr:galactokinase [Candidatus Aminicenantes bacterium]